MSVSISKPKLDNLANEIWKSAERLRGKFKAYEYQGVILPIIVIRRLECVLIDWREKKAEELCEGQGEFEKKVRQHCLHSADGKMGSDEKKKLMEAIAEYGF